MTTESDSYFDPLQAQAEVFKQQFIQSVSKYEGKIKELSILKEMSEELRSAVFSDRGSFLSSQLAVIKRAANLYDVSLLLVEESLQMFEVIDSSVSGAARTEWCPMHNHAANFVVTHRKHLSQVGQEGRGDILYVPVISNNSTIGVLRLEDDSLREHGSNILSFYSMIADQLATAIILANMHHRILMIEKQQLQASRFFSKSVAQKIFSSQGDLQAEGRRVDVTAIFADICDFTTISESMDEQHVVEFLNSFFSLLTPIIFNYDGTLDKFMGDGIMAFFGAPVPHEDDTLRAVRAAVEMVQAARVFKDVDCPLESVNISIGINLGKAVAGCIGTQEHLSYTVIGDVVNTAQRLESLAEPGSILIGDSVYRSIVHDLDSIEGLASVEQLPPTQVKGRRQAVKPYRLVVE